MAPGTTTYASASAIPDDVHALLDAATAADGRFPLSDHVRLELAHGGGPGFAAITVEADGALAGYAQLATINGVRTIEMAVHPDHRDEGTRRRLLAAAIDAVAADGGGRVQWWAYDATDADADLATTSGLTMTRELLQLRVPLPLDRRPTVTTRPFERGHDEDAFLTVNNRAFAGHPEQSGWTRDTLRRREEQPWFDPAGFLLHERDGRLAAFCWTKVHADEDPALGEIYVIAVDPDFQGLGLGTQLTVAGLAWLAGRGLAVGMLHVDAANTAAVRTYERLGFTRHRVDRAFTADVAGR